jgi:hypothetical protein
VVRPWFDMPAEVKAMEPAEVLDTAVLRHGVGLDDDQKEVLTVWVFTWRKPCAILWPRTCLTHARL